MASSVTFVFSLIILSVLSCVSSNGYEDGKYAITIPNARPNLPEIYLCTGIKLNNDSDYYLVKFEPRATQEIIHHMVLHGCQTPGSTKPVWSCTDPDNIAGKEYETSSMCETKDLVLYAWAKNATSLSLPPDVGFKIGGNTSIQYLVAQFHYVATVNKTDDGSVAFSQLLVHYTRQPQRKLAGIFFLGSTGSIAPKSTATWDSACLIVENQRMHPFAFRVHAHHYGTVISGYRVRRDSNGKDHWTLIGKKSPQKPNMFNPVANNITVTKGDTIAIRCSYYNNQTYVIEAGINDKDEMCNYYIMYYVDEGEQPLRMQYCWTKGSPSYYWELEVNNIPDDASAPELTLEHK